jgi:Spy/CpxP family protein refolding chaperone
MPMMPQNAEAMTDRLMLMMTGKLKLTDAESTQIRPIVQGQIEQLQKDMEAQKTAHQKMIDDAKMKIRTILTPDQQKQFDQMMAGMGGPKAQDQSAPAGK